MSLLDDQPLHETSDAAGAGVPTPGRGLSAGWIVAGVAIGAVALGGGWWWASRTPPATAPAPLPVTAAPVAPAVLEEPPAQVLPPLAQMDAFVRQLLGGLSPQEDLARWLETDALTEHLAAGIRQVAAGQSPARDFAALRPAQPFSTERRGGRRRIALASDQRYDAVVLAITALDADGVARAYRILTPRLQDAFVRQGGQGAIDDALRQAIDHILETPVPDGPYEVVGGEGTSWLFASADLEALSSAQKQLLRLGPVNARAVQGQLRAIRRAVAAAATAPLR